MPILTDDELKEQRDATLKRNGAGFFRPPIEELGFIPHPEPDSAPRGLFSARICPNGEFGLGFLHGEHKSAEDKRQDRQIIYEQEFETVNRIHEVMTDTGYWVAIEDPTDQYSAPKLGSSVELSQPTKKYGLHGITALGRTTIRNAGNVIDIICRGRYGVVPQMGTLTIPTMSPDDMRMICLKWHIIQKRFFEKCKRSYEKMGLRWDYVSCTEIQPTRWEVRREVGLHLHFLFIAHRISAGVWSLPDSWVRSVWRGCIENAIGKRITQVLNYRRESVYTSSAAYLAKYLSKGGQIIEEICTELGEDYIPSQWWSCSTKLKKCIKAHTLRNRTDKAELLEFIIKENMTEYLAYVRTVHISQPYKNQRTGQECVHEMLVGYGGRLTRAGVLLFYGENPDKSIRLYMGNTLDR